MAAKRKKTKPAKQEAAGARDPANGRFRPGFSGNPAGRQRGPDFRTLVNQHHGASLQEKLLGVFDALLLEAQDGDVAAAKLLLDRVCDPEPEQLHVTHDGAVGGTGVGPPIPDPGALKAWAKRLAELVADD